MTYYYVTLTFLSLVWMAKSYVHARDGEVVPEWGSMIVAHLFILAIIAITIWGPDKCSTGS